MYKSFFRDGLLTLRTWVRGHSLTLPVMHKCTYPFTNGSHETEAEAISLARECDVPDILPAAFYALSVQKWSCSAEGGRSHTVLHPSDLRRLIAGREGLQDMLIDCIANPLHSNALVCGTCRPFIERFWRTKLAPDPMSPWGCWLLHELRQMTPERDITQYYTSWCDSCAYQHHTIVCNRLFALKEAIPRLFKL